MNILQKSIAAIGLGAALALSAPATLLAGGPQHARPAVKHGHQVGHGNSRHYRAYRGSRARHANRHWRQHHRGYRHHPRWRDRRARPYYEEPAASETSIEPTIVISPNIQLGGGGGYEGGGVPSSTLGTVVGAVAGAAIGSRIGKGRGNTAAIAIGSVVGGHLGGRIGTQ